MANLKKTLRDNLKAKIEKDREGELNFGIDLEIAGVGASFSTENGGTVGIGIGIIGIEYNAQGGGKVEYFNGLYSMEVEKVGCSYIKDYYIGGQFAYTEVQKIPECIEQEEFTSEIEIPDEESKNDIISSNKLPPEQYIKKITITRSWDYYNSNLEVVNSETTTFVREFGRGTAGWNIYLYEGQFEEHTSDYSYPLGDPRRFDERTKIGYCLAASPEALPEEEKSYFILSNSMVGWHLYTLQEQEHTAKALWQGTDAFVNIGDMVARPSLARVLTAYNWNITFGNLEAESQNNYSPPIPKLPKNHKKKMKQECCGLTEDENALLKLTARAVGALSFPGTIKIQETEEGKKINAKFPTEETEDLILNHIQLKLKLLQLSPQEVQQTDNELLEKVALNLGIPIPEKSPESVYLPEGITKENNVYGFPFKIPRNWLQPGAKGEITIHNQPQLLLIATAMISSGSSDKLDKIASLLGIPEKGEVLNPKGEETYQKDSDTGFPIEIPDYLNQPKKKDGLYEKDLKKYPKIKLNNLRELELYRLQMFQELYRFSGALSTVREGFEMGVDLWIPNASENEKEYPHELTGILARMVNIIDAHGLPLSLNYNIKGTDGDIPAEPLNTKAYIEILGDTVQHLYQKSVRNQITLSKLALLGTSLHKILIVIYRLIKVSIKGIGIPIRDTIKEEAEKTGQDTEIETQFDATGFIRGGFSPSTGDKNELSKSFTPDDEDIDKIQDDINKPGIINSKGFDLKNRTIPLWLKLFRQ